MTSNNWAEVLTVVVCLFILAVTLAVIIVAIMGGSRRRPKSNDPDVPDGYNGFIDGYNDLDFDSYE